MMKMIFGALLTAVLVPFLVDAGRLTVFLHIGPHKTGSTHIQSYLVRHWTELEKDHVCLPLQTQGYSKDFSVISREVRANNSRADHFLNMKKCLEKGMNVVISSEDLAGLSLDVIRTFKSLIYTAATGIDIEVKVILYYREWLNSLYSIYSEVAKSNHPHTTSFPEYFMVAEWGAGFNYDAALSNYNAVFGEENIVVVDYYGAETAKKDIAYVFVCEILQAMCNQSALLNTVEKNRENTKPNEVYLHYLSLFKFYLHAHSVQFCTRDMDNNLMYLAELEKRKVEFPATTSTSNGQLKVLRGTAIHRDAKFHAKYRHLILYSNHEANLKKIEDFKFSEVDTDRFLGDARWQSFMKQEMQTFLRNGKLCSLEMGSKMSMI
jgi:hypothetical protein